MLNLFSRFFILIIITINFVQNEKIKNNLTAFLFTPKEPEINGFYTSEKVNMDAFKCLRSINIKHLIFLIYKDHFHPNFNGLMNFNAHYGIFILIYSLFICINS